MDKVLVPYVNMIKQKSGLDAKQKALLLLDVYKCHRDEDLLKLLKDKGIVCVYIPASCTGELQPLDLTVNAKFKFIMKELFIEWYAAKVDGNPDTVVDLALSVVKPLHAKWLINAMSQLTERRSLIQSGFTKAGL